MNGLALTCGAMFVTGAIVTAIGGYSLMRNKTSTPLPSLLPQATAARPISAPGEAMPPSPGVPVSRVPVVTLSDHNSTVVAPAEGVAVPIRLRVREPLRWRFHEQALSDGPPVAGPKRTRPKDWIPGDADCDEFWVVVPQCGNVFHFQLVDAEGHAVRSFKVELKTK